MKMVVLDGYTLNPGDLSWDRLRELGEIDVYDRTPPDKIVERARGAGIVLTNKVPLSKETLDRLPGLKFIAVTATGYDMVDVAAAGKQGIAVSNVPEYGTDAVAQFVFALLLALCHHVGRHDRSVRGGQWARSPDWSYWNSPQILLKGKKMGIVGFGRIGGRVGELAAAFGMEVMAFNPHTRKNPGFPNFSWKSLEELFAEADVVTLHCLMTPSNKGFVDAKRFGLMKKSAFFINVARGGLVNEQDLCDALNNEKIAAAAIDVVSTEPILADNPLLKAKNCLITPHIAWAASAARQKLMDETMGNIRAFLAGNPANVVNGRYLGSQEVKA